MGFNFSNYIPQLIFLFISYLFGRHSTKLANRRISCMERYDHLYSPLIDLIVKNTDSMKYEDGEYKFYLKIYSLVWENLKYAGENTVSIFSGIVYEMSLYQELNIKQTKLLILSLLEESKHLEKSLEYPLKSQILSDWFL